MFTKSIVVLKHYKLFFVTVATYNDFYFAMFRFIKEGKFIRGEKLCRQPTYDYVVPLSQLNYEPDIQIANKRILK